MRRVILYTLLILLCYPADAQDISCNKTWKKIANRSINANTIDKNHAIATQIITAVKEHKLTAYTLTGYAAPPIMTTEQLTHVLNGFPDSTTVTDPITGKEILIVRRRTTLPDSVCVYQVNEECSFHPEQLSLDINIRYVYPTINMYDLDSVYTGRRPLFRLKYHDLKQYLEQHKEQHEMFNTMLWQNYFVLPHNAQYPGADDGIFHTNATITLDMTDSPYLDEHTIRNIPGDDRDTALSQMLIDRIETGQIRAWSADTTIFTRQLTTEALLKSMPPPDTITIEEFPTSYNIPLRNPEHTKIHKYKLLLACTFDPKEGKTQFRVTAVAPCWDRYSDEGTIAETKTMFWVRYTDIKPLIDRSEQYHPNNTFALHLWNHFFVDDAKPVLEK